MPTEGDFLNNHRYQILRVLSDKGGMGVIYQATDLSFNKLDSILPAASLPLCWRGATRLIFNRSKT